MSGKPMRAVVMLGFSVNGPHGSARSQAIHAQPERSLLPPVPHEVLMIRVTSKEPNVRKLTAINLHAEALDKYELINPATSCGRSIELAVSLHP